MGAVCLSTFALTLTNPMTILSFAAIFAGLGLGSTPAGAMPAALLVGGVFAGSLAWWLILKTGASAIGARLGGGAPLWINRFSGVVIGAFGMLALGRTFFGP